MDLTTMRALIKSELHMNSPYVDGAIADSIAFCRKEPLKFNGGKYNLTLEANRYDYDLPTDFISMRGDVYLTPNSETNQYRYKMHSTTVDSIEEYIFTNPTAEDLGFTSDRVFTYAIDTVTEQSPNTSKLLIAPRPSSGGQNVFFRYTKDIGTPVYTASVTTSSPPALQNVTTLLGPDGETLPSDFTNEWFKTGAKLIRARAMFYLWTTYHGGTEEANIKAQNALLQWNEELLRLRTETNINNIPTSIRKFI